jgi:hypothetical protein
MMIFLYSGPKAIRRHRKKFSATGNLAPEICASLIIKLMVLAGKRLAHKTEQNPQRHSTQQHTPRQKDTSTKIPYAQLHTTTYEQIKNRMYIADEAG